MPTEAAGLGPAVSALADAAPTHAEEQQLLFESSPLFGGEKPIEARRGPGRPPGAENRNTSEWVRYIQSHYRSPLLFLADLTIADTENLAQRMGCKRIEALTLQKAAAAELAPYLHRKQPIAVDAGEGVPMPKIVHAILDIASIGQVTGAKEEIVLTPLPAEDEVADPKSHTRVEGQLSE